MPQPAASNLAGRRGAAILLAQVFCGLAGAAQTPTWAQAFGEARPAVHLIASYPDARGTPQPLEYWRTAQGQVIRRTGNRAELRLTPTSDGEDQYQLRNLLSHTAFDVHRVNLVRVGIFTDRWSVQHLLDRPSSAYTLSNMNRTVQLPAGRCAWWRISLASGGVSEVCWSAALGLPLQLKSGGRTVLNVIQVQPLSAFPAATLPKDWQEYNADEDLGPD